jgi:hypothetical protein
VVEGQDLESGAALRFLSECGEEGLMRSVVGYWITRTAVASTIFVY